MARGDYIEQHRSVDLPLYFINIFFFNGIYFK